MNLIFSDNFADSVKRYSSIKDTIRKKVDMIAESPISLGEPLKGNFRGYYSCPVRRNFLILFLYCSICRKKKDDALVLCADCATCTDDTIKFVALGPHDKVYFA
jgi:mRNA-degrading endonuclease YafQ of YafQ-DinJ toxin-antitoxin module